MMWKIIFYRDGKSKHRKDSGFKVRLNPQPESRNISQTHLIPFFSNFRVCTSSLPTYQKEQFKNQVDYARTKVFKKSCNFAPTP